MPSRLTTVVAALLIGPACLSSGNALAFWKPDDKKLIHFGYPAEVGYVRQNVNAMKALPFDGTIVVINELRALFDYERRHTPDDLRASMDDLTAIDWGRLTENFLVLNVETKSRIDWFDDAQWEIVEHNLRLAIEAVNAGGLRGIIFDPEQYNYRLWVYDKAKHRDTISYERYIAQMRRRGAQWMRVVQSVKPDIAILNLYLMTAFNSYYGVRETPGGDTPERLEQSGYGLYLGFINGMLSVAGPDVTLIDGNEPAYYYGGRAAYDKAYVQIKQERIYLIDPEHRHTFRRQVEAGSSIYIQGTMGMRNYSIQALGAFLSPEDRLKLLEHRAYQALRTTDRYVWCYSDSKHINWWKNQVPAGAAEALASAKRKIATGAPLGFSEAPFVEAKRKQQQIMTEGRASIVPRRLVVTHVGADGPPKIDGRLNDAVWRRVKPTERFRVPNIFIKSKIQAPTTAQVAWDQENLYVAFTCIEPKVEQMSKRKTGHDSSVWYDDCVEVFISAGDDLFPYRHFEINSLDTHFDATWVQRKKMDATWNAKWTSRSAVLKDRWLCEIAIPWTVIGTRPASGETRRANVTRHRIPHEEETTTWTPMYKTFSDAEYFGTWIFKGAAP
ncbi:MAG: hypothetical protein CMJ18_21750 [Phycisphaeraceae bacterium]|nr:hypothetical protein [Phycisphaeraceae bacterium]